MIKVRNALMIYGLLYITGLAISQIFIPVKRLFSYYSIGTNFGVPYLLGSLSNFDGNHYVRIAQYGYGEYQHAFFPLYSIFIKYTGFLFSGNYIYSGVFTTSVSFIIAVWLWQRLANRFALPVYQSLVWLLIYPTSFFLIAIYTESLFIALLLGYILLTYKNSLYAIIVGYLLGLTRFNGTFAAIIPATLIAIELVRSRRFEIKNIYVRVLATLAPLLGLATYMTYLFYTKGNALEFIDAQKGFHNGRSTHIVLLPQVIYRYVQIFINARDPLLLSISVFEFLMFTIAFSLIALGIYKWYKSHKSNLFGASSEANFYLGILIFSACNLILPTLTGTLSSVPRYILLCPAVFFELARLKNKLLKIVLAILFVVLNIAAHALFTSAYFVS